MIIITAVFHPGIQLPIIEFRFFKYRSPRKYQGTFMAMTHESHRSKIDRRQNQLKSYLKNNC